MSGDKFKAGTGAERGENEAADTEARNSSAAGQMPSPDRYRVIFQTSNIGIVSTDLSGNFIEANPAYCAMLGYELDEILRLNIADLTHPGDLPANLQARLRVHAGEEGAEIIEKRYLHRSGRVVWARLVGSPVRDEQGRVSGLFAMVEDITELKAAEAQRSAVQAELEVSERRLNYITSASLDLIWDWDLLRSSIWWGQGSQSLFGFDTAMLGEDEKFWVSRVHPDDRATLHGAFQAVIEGGEDGWDLRFRIRKLDDSYTQVRERAFAIRDEGGKPVRIVGGVNDISDTLELEERLRQSQRLEALGQLTGGVAHDFNNLLTVMVGNAELLSEALGDDERLRELAETIVRSGMQGADLTRRLLAFARRQALAPKNIDLNYLIDNMGRILVRTLGEQIMLELCPAAELWLCMVDPNQMESAILNLCLNARDAMPDGGKLVIETGNVAIDAGYANTHFELEPGDYVCLAISDTGVGIPQEHLDKVFEPFFTTKEKGKGTGLGLSTIFGFIKQSNGHMNIYSELGHGTTVKIYLPRSRAGILPDTLLPTENEAPGGGNECILLVEDDALVRQYAENLLGSLGYRVLSAVDGQQALELLNTYSGVDLLFTDVIMPGGMNGRELADLAREIRPGLKVLFTSGYTENSIFGKGGAGDDVQLLGKPYQRHELAARLRSLLEKQGGDRGRQELEGGD